MPDIFVAKPKKTASAAKTNTLQKESTLFDIGKTRLTQEISPSPAGNSGKTTLMGLLSRENSHLFTSFSKNPMGVSFQNQEPDEQILFFVRKDFITNFLWILIGAVLIAAPVFVAPFSLLLGINILFFPLRFFFFFIIFYYIFTATYIYINFITWYFNLSLATDIRVVEVTFESLIYKNVSATKLDLVQDVSYSQIGIVRTFFDYGDVLIQTAGTIDNFIFDAVPEPENVVHIIEDLIGKEKRL